jgi:hypothetical protein
VPSVFPFFFPLFPFVACGLRLSKRRPSRVNFACVRAAPCSVRAALFYEGVDVALTSRPRRFYHGDRSTRQTRTEFHILFVFFPLLFTSSGSIPRHGHVVLPCCNGTSSNPTGGWSPPPLWLPDCELVNMLRDRWIRAVEYAIITR